MIVYNHRGTKCGVAADSDIFKDVLGAPALSIFVWQDGAAFDGRMNDYMSAQFPAGIDPRSAMALNNRVSLVGNLTVAGSMLTRNASTS